MCLSMRCQHGAGQGYDADVQQAMRKARQEGRQNRAFMISGIDTSSELIRCYQPSLADGAIVEAKAGPVRHLAASTRAFPRAAAEHICSCIPAMRCSFA